MADVFFFFFASARNPELYAICNFFPLFGLKSNIKLIPAYTHPYNSSSYSFEELQKLSIFFIFLYIKILYIDIIYNIINILYLEIQLYIASTLTRLLRI